MEREIEGQQPPPRHRQAPDPHPTARGNAPDEPTAPTEAPSSPTARHLLLWRSTIARFATRHPLTRRKLAVAAVIVGVLAFLFGIHSPSPPSVPPQTSPDTHQFSVTDRPTLVFDHFIGNVNVSPGPGGQVSIKEKKNGETDSIAIHYAQHGNTIMVTADIPGGLMSTCRPHHNLGNRHARSHESQRTDRAEQLERCYLGHKPRGIHRLEDAERFYQPHERQWTGGSCHTERHNHQHRHPPPRPLVHSGGERHDQLSRDAKPHRELSVSEH